jgi:hypothetical protein
VHLGCSVPRAIALSQTVRAGNHVWALEASAGCPPITLLPLSSSLAARLLGVCRAAAE